MRHMRETPTPRLQTYFRMAASLLALATLLTGCFGLATAFTTSGIRETQAMGLIAAALAFGLLFIAIWRK